MDFNPFSESANFVDLLTSQQNVASQAPFLGSGGSGANTEAIRKERRAWTPTDDVVLISLWLNTSKDPIVGNEQRSSAFWKRIAEYYNASPKLAGCEKREAAHCKNRWHKINDVVCKFCGAYEAANKERSSGQNETDVLKRAHEIFFTNHNKKFTLEYAWKELRNDQKWSELSASKKRKCEDSEHSATEGSIRPEGVKAAKARGKKTMEGGKDLDASFETMWIIKQQDLKMKERVSKMRLLERLLAKEEPLADYEEALKKQLSIELMSN
ncbi:glutathione S-transferase T3-like [Brassica napus]|uniref:glutathione S-transferase T3-like n=1 Tax=Brassica napus TaxID=3708 RepID=UPI0006AA7687|nr:glutathione S-transferase T3-like [Brassica napus]